MQKERKENESIKERKREREKLKERKNQIKNDRKRMKIDESKITNKMIKVQKSTEIRIKNYKT